MFSPFELTEFHILSKYHVVPSVEHVFCLIFGFFIATNEAELLIMDFET